MNDEDKKLICICNGVTIVSNWTMTWGDLKDCPITTESGHHPKMSDFIDASEWPPNHPFLTNPDIIFRNHKWEVI